MQKNGSIRKTEYTDLSGWYEAELEDKKKYQVLLPGTLDENHVGNPDSAAHQWKAEVIKAENEADAEHLITTRFTRKHVYEGRVIYRRGLQLKTLPGERAFAMIERSRKQELRINEKTADIVFPGTLSTPAVYEVTKLLHTGINEVELVCDNSYAGWPHDAIVYSSAATDETQTNWNGILGEMRIRWEKRNFIRAIRVYPEADAIRAEVEIDAMVSGSGLLKLTSDAFAENCSQHVTFEKGITCCSFAHIPYCRNVRRWDEYEGNLYKISAVMDNVSGKTALFGIRVFDAEYGVLRNNGHRIFLRGEANCCVFPEKGHMPMKKSEWKKILRIYRSYGVNCLRFHSHCPPEAAFAAADEEGIFVQPELSHWNPENAFEQEESRSYYRMELHEILRTYANHPSFVMLTFGNELSMGEKGEKYMHALLDEAHKQDSTRLYAGASNISYGSHGPDQHSDFYTSSNNGKDMLRGTSAGMEGYINHEYPSSLHDYSHEMKHLREKYAGPVFSFEVGQYEILPDFSEIRQFRGVTKPDNLRIIRRKIGKLDLKYWERMLEATGELALICYREETEAVLRTPEMSGISLLGIQDFPGQGTALVGMLNSHLRTKPYAFAAPERFRKFYTGILPVALFPKYTYENGEMFQAELKMANYGKDILKGKMFWRLMEAQNIRQEGKNDGSCCIPGTLTMTGSASLKLPETDRAVCYTLQLCYKDKKRAIFNNEYRIWSYPHLNTVRLEEDGSACHENVFITQSVGQALQHLRNGECVFLSPKALADQFSGSAAGMFSTDFWSVGTFPQQEGYMGCLIDEKHPIFKNFPTLPWPQWQWWSITTGARSMKIPEHLNAIISVIDCYARLRRLAFLFECRVGSGRLTVSSMGLLEKQEYPETRALLQAILAYMNTEGFAPETSLTEDELTSIL